MKTKKILMAAMCCLTLSMGSALAQNEMPEGRNGRPMRGGAHGGMRGMEVVADTAITNHMGLTEDQLKRVEEINANYQAQMQEMMSQGRRSQEGMRLSREEREARMQQITAQKKEARQQLRSVLGDELYIQYLETQLDRLPSMMIGRGGFGGEHHGPRGGGRMGGGRMGGGRMDGGFGNDGFGDNDGF